MRVSDYIGCGLLFALMIAYFVCIVPSTHELRQARKINELRQQQAIYVPKPTIINEGE